MTVAGVEDCYVLGLSYAGTPGGVEVHCPVGGATRVYDATMPGEMNLGFRGVDAMRAEVNYHLMMHDYPLDFPAFGCTPQFRTKHKGDADFIGEYVVNIVLDGTDTDAASQSCPWRDQCQALLGAFVELSVHVAMRVATCLSSP